MPKNRQRLYYKTVFTVSGFAATSTVVFTTEAKKGRFIVERITAYNKVLAGSGVLPKISIGWTVSGFADLVNTFQLTQATVFAVEWPTLIPNYLSIPASTAVQVNVTNVATGYTSCGYEFYIEGYYEN